MAQPIFGIEEFPDDDLLWRVVLFGGISRNARVPSEPVIEALLASIPSANIDPLGKDAMQSFAIYIAKIGVGQLPYVSIGSVWHRQKPMAVQIPNFHHIKKEIDTSRARFVSVGDLVMKHNVIPKSHYAFDKLLTAAATTQMVAIEIKGDPWAILIPVSELVRFYYAPSSRLAQALFWGEYAKSINEDKCGQLNDGPYRVHLRKWISDSDAWTLARFHSSEGMQEQVRHLYQGLQNHCVRSDSAYPKSFRGFQCGFPFSGTTRIEAIHVPLPCSRAGTDRALILKLLRCSAPFPFDQLLCDRDNRNLKGKNSGEEDLEPGWRRKIEQEDQNLDEWGNPIEEKLHSDSEPDRGTPSLQIDIRENRFADLDGKRLLKEEPERQKFRSAPMVGGNGPPLHGFGTGSGVWSGADRKRAEINTSRPGTADKPMLPPSLNTFFSAMRALSSDKFFSVRYVSAISEALELTSNDTSIGFPNYDPAKRKKIKWARTLCDGKFRSRQVVVAEVKAGSGYCYVLEAERRHDHEKLSILVVAAENYAQLTGTEVHSILLGSACKGRWLTATEMTELRRATTTHQQIASAAALADRIRRKACEVLGLPHPKMERKKAGAPNAADNQKTMAQITGEVIKEA